MMERQKVHPVPFEAQAGTITQVDFGPDRAALAFGVMGGVPSLTIEAVLVGDIKLPAIRFDLVDSTWLYLWPAVIVPAHVPLRLLVRAKKRVKDHLEFLVWFDEGAPQWLQQQKTSRNNSLHMLG